LASSTSFPAPIPFAPRAQALRADVAAPRKYNGLFLAPKAVPKANTQAIANDIVAQIELDLKRANPHRPRTVVSIGSAPQRETPVVIARRLFRGLFSPLSA
jgi:hypothetical protein